MNVNPEKKLEEMKNAIGILDDLTAELFKRMVTHALCEKNYRQALANKQLEFRTRGKNEPANLVLNYAKGAPDVAELRYKRDIAQIEVDVCKEELRNRRIDIECLRSSLAFDRATYLNS